jgi:uncharacterized membrane protein YccC
MQVRGGRRPVPHETGGKRIIRGLALGLAIALVVFLVTAGHVIYLPLLFLPLGFFGFGHRRRHRRYW